MGGVRMANALGLHVNVYHMNEGHAALLTLALLESQLGGGPLGAATESDLAVVRNKCVFTTHTPVPAGHDQFSTEQDSHSRRRAHLAAAEAQLLPRRPAQYDLLALRFSRYVNGVAMQHGKVSRDMFPEFQIDSITNGVHAATWISEPIQQMLDTHIPAWRRDNLYLRNAIDLPEKAILSAHARAKENLLAEVGARTGLVLNPRVLTLGFARRVATYKRASLLFTDPERLASIAAKPAACRSSSPARRIPRTSRARRSSARYSTRRPSSPATC